jgi:hypothetical protein
MKEIYVISSNIVIVKTGFTDLSHGRINGETGFKPVSASSFKGD